MRQNYSFSKNSNALLEPCEGKLSCTVLRGESPSNGADLLDILSYTVPMSRFKEMYHTMRSSCLFDTHAWGKIKERIQLSDK